jgi:glyoxylase-like metal-dependent hydrolase (beta-lactamase superfamily II)
LFIDVDTDPPSCINLFKPTPDRVGMIHEIFSYGQSSNVFIIEDDITLMIDSGIGDKSVHQAVEDKGLTIDIIINTHCHVDHIYGNQYFPEAKIYAHELDAGDIETGTDKTLWYWGFEKPLKFPVATRLKEGDVVKTGNYHLEVVYTPGHTEGCISLYEPEKKIMFTGDCVFDMGIGRMDLPTGDSEQMKQSLQRLLEFDIETFYGGHGGAGKKENIERWLKFYF